MTDRPKTIPPIPAVVRIELPAAQLVLAVVHAYESEYALSPEQQSALLNFEARVREAELRSEAEPLCAKTACVCACHAKSGARVVFCVPGCRCACHPAELRR